MDDPVTRWLPGFPIVEPAVRLRHMLNQNSGLSDLVAMEPPAYENTLESALEFFARMKMDFSPGERFAYCNMNFDLLHHVVQAVDGRSFAQYLVEELTQPQGHPSLAMCAEESTEIEGLARGYTIRDDEVGPGCNQHMDSNIADGREWTGRVLTTDAKRRGAQR